MQKGRILCVVPIALTLLIALGCGKQPSTAIHPVKLKMFAPLPEGYPAQAAALTEEKINLGRMLYYEPRLSKSQKISCNSCHGLSTYGVDGEPTSNGHKGQKGDRNSPTVYNSAGHFVQFWDGRAANVEEQAKGPVLNPVEMAMPNDRQVITVLKSIPEYVDAFKKAFPEDRDPVTYDNMAKAIGAFERKLVTPARWDKFLKGDQAALTEEEKIGFNTFTTVGCQACHAGALLGGNLYQKLGLVKPYPDASDPGRAKVTKKDADRMLFKVPALRNIEKTGPYFHNGKVAALDQAVAHMAEYQLGKPLSETEVRSIIAFLKSLTGDIPVDYIKEPALPKSTSKTPKPDLTD
ncbi:MAG: cytochrome-c peroxidase [Bryobacterales bacterium]|nr:cytochrome-c peroxidase [Bryobacterales bacterium]